jgi:chromosome segregation ATPase
MDPPGRTRLSSRTPGLLFGARREARRERDDATKGETMNLEFRLQRASDNWRTALANMATVRDALANAEADINSDPTATAEMKDLAIKEARRRMSSRIEQAVAQANEAKEDLTRARDDGWRARTINSDARSRVRSLLAAGTAPGDVIATAIKTRDAEALAALRAEAPWHKVGNTSLDTPGVLGAIDEAMLQVGDPGDRDLAEASQRLASLDEVANRSAELSLSQAAGRVDPRARIAFGLAENEAEGFVQEGGNGA